MINVLHLRASNFYGGPEKQIVEHGLRVNKDRFRFILCPFREGNRVSELESVAVSLGLTVTPLIASSSFSPFLITRLLNILKHFSVNILCTHGYKPNVISQIAVRIHKIPLITFSRGWTYENRRVRFYESLDRLFIKSADYVVAVSQGHKTELAKLGIEPSHMTVIHNAVNSSKPPQQGAASLKSILGVGAESQVVVSAGRLSPEKNFSALIDAAAIIRRELPDTVFAIFGDGVLREDLAARVEASGLKSCFFLPGFRKDFTALLHEVDLFVLPSLTEGLPNVVLEAFACAKPVVATAVGGVPEIVEDGINGVLVPKERPDLLAEAIKGCLADPGKSRMMGEAGYNKVKSEFTFESQTQKLEAIYNEILKEF